MRYRTDMNQHDIGCIQHCRFEYISSQSRIMGSGGRMISHWFCQVKMFRITLFLENVSIFCESDGDRALNRLIQDEDENDGF